MDIPRTSPAHWAIFIIGLLQVGVVLGGTLFVSGVMRANGYETSRGFGAPYSGAAVFVRHYGLSLLILPAAWIAGSIYSGRETAPRYLRRVFLVIGVVAVLVGIFAYLRCAGNCYSWSGFDGGATRSHGGLFGFPF